MNNSNRFGLGEPVYTPRAVRYSPAHRTYGMGAAEAAATPAGQDPAAAFMTGLSKSIEEQTKKACDQVGNVVNDAVKAGLGLVKDLFDENKCETDQGRAGNALNNCIQRIVGSQLNYIGAERENLTFRTCEALAKADPKVAGLNWYFAYYCVNAVEPNGIGSAYDTSRKKKQVRALKERWHNFPDSSKNEVGPCGLRTAIRSALKTALLLEETLTRIPNLADRKLIMLGWLLRWIPGRFDVKTGVGTRGVCRGLDFLVKDALKSPKMQEFLLDPTLSAVTAASGGELQVGDTSKPAGADATKPPPSSARPTRVATKADPALAKARIEATKAALLKAKSAGDLKKAQMAADPVAMAQLEARKAEILKAKTGTASQTAEAPAQQQAPAKSGAGGMIALAAAGLGAYFMLKG